MKISLAQNDVEISTFKEKIKELATALYKSPADKELEFKSSIRSLIYPSQPVLLQLVPKFQPSFN